MATVVRELPGDKKLGEIEMAIKNEEAGFSEFQSSKMSLVGGAPGKNEMTFKRLGLGGETAEFKLTLTAAAKPDGFSQIWQGTMLMENKPEQVTAWRKK